MTRPMCDYLPGRKVTALLNPCTATMVHLTPPYQISPDASQEAARRELDDLIRRFEAYCLAAWELGHLDPAEVTTVAGWADKPLPPVADTGWLKTERDERRQPGPSTVGRWVEAPMPERLLKACPPDPWWRRLLRRPPRFQYYEWVGHTPPGGTTNPPGSGE